MSGRASFVLALEIFLGVLYLSSIVVLSHNSKDFILARHAPTIAVLPLGATIRFSEPLTDKAAFLGDWRSPEDWGVWMQRSRAEIVLKPPTGQPIFLAMSARILIPANGTQHVRIGFNGQSAATVTVAGTTGVVTCNWVSALPPVSQDLSVLGFDVEQQEAPVELGVGTDDRPVGLGLATLSFVGAKVGATCDRSATIEVISGS